MSGGGGECIWPVKSWRKCTLCRVRRRSAQTDFEKDRRLHTFPTKNSMAKYIWTRRCEIVKNNFQWDHGKKLCSEHFKDFRGPTKDNPLPTMFPVDMSEDGIFTIEFPCSNFKEMYEDVENGYYLSNTEEVDHDLEIAAATTFRVDDIVQGFDKENSISYIQTVDQSRLDVSINLHDYFAFLPQQNIVTERPNEGSQSPINGLPLNILLPNTPQYITYEGSMTQPGCQETVTWVIFNKPIYFTTEQLRRLRNINSGAGGEHLLLFGNIRPSKPINNRLIRTNISYRPRTKACSMAKEVFYEVNTIKPRRTR